MARLGCSISGEHTEPRKVIPPLAAPLFPPVDPTKILAKVKTSATAAAFGSISSSHVMLLFHDLFRNSLRSSALCQEHSRVRLARAAAVSLSPRSSVFCFPLCCCELSFLAQSDKTLSRVQKFLVIVDTGRSNMAAASSIM